MVAVVVVVEVVVAAAVVVVVVLEGRLPGDLAKLMTPLFFRGDVADEAVVMGLCLHDCELAVCPTFRLPGVSTIRGAALLLTGLEAWATTAPDTENTDKVDTAAVCRRGAGGRGTPLSGALTSMMINR